MRSRHFWCSIFGLNPTYAAPLSLSSRLQRAMRCLAFFPSADRSARLPSLRRAALRLLVAGLACVPCRWCALPRWRTAPRLPLPASPAPSARRCSSKQRRAEGRCRGGREASLGRLQSLWNGGQQPRRSYHLPGQLSGQAAAPHAPRAGRAQALSGCPCARRLVTSLAGFCCPSLPPPPSLAPLNAHPPAPINAHAPTPIPPPPPPQGADRAQLPLLGHQDAGLGSLSGQEVHL